MEIQKQLTEKQYKVFELTGRGFTQVEIGLVLGLSAKTIDFHQREIRKRLKVKNTNRLIRLAVATEMAMCYPIIFLLLSLLVCNAQNTNISIVHVPKTVDMNGNPVFNKPINFIPVDFPKVDTNGNLVFGVTNSIKTTAYTYDVYLYRGQYMITYDQYNFTNYVNLVGGTTYSLVDLVLSNAPFSGTNYIINNYSTTNSTLTSNYLAVSRAYITADNGIYQQDTSAVAPSIRFTNTQGLAEIDGDTGTSIYALVNGITHYTNTTLYGQYYDSSGCSTCSNAPYVFNGTNVINAIGYLGAHFGDGAGLTNLPINTIPTNDLSVYLNSVIQGATNVILATGTNQLIQAGFIPNTALRVNPITNGNTGTIQYWSDLNQTSCIVIGAVLGSFGMYESNGSFMTVLTNGTFWTTNKSAAGQSMKITYNGVIDCPFGVTIANGGTTFATFASSALNSFQDFLFQTDANNNIGQAGTKRPKFIYAYSNVVTAGFLVTTNGLNIWSNATLTTPPAGVWSLQNSNGVIYKVTSTSTNAL